MKMVNPEDADFSFTNCELRLDQMQVSYDAIVGAELRIPIPVMIDNLEQNSRIQCMSRQMIKAMRHLSKISMIAEVRSLEPELDIEQQPETN